MDRRNCGRAAAENGLGSTPEHMSAAKLGLNGLEGPRALVALLPGGRPRPPPSSAAPLASFAPIGPVDVGALKARRLAPEPGITASGRLKAAHVAAPPLTPAVAMTKLAKLEDFDFLARRDNVPGAPQVRSVKFLMTGLDTAKPKLFLINTKNFDYHYEFFTQGLGRHASLEQFNADTYFTDQRKNVAGTLLYHDAFEGSSGQTGLFAVEFWPTDPVKAAHVAKVFSAVEKAMPFAGTRIAYHPAGNTQEALYQQEKAALEHLGVRSVTSAELFKNITYSPMNLGEGFGRLRVIDAATGGSQPPTVRDVVVLKTIPNDLSHVAGIITEQPQTPLSHINLKAKQNATPNAYLKNASDDPRIAPLVGKYVYYKVGAEGLEIREATQAEVDQHLEQIRPKKKQIPRRSLTLKHPVRLDQIGASAARSVGAKAANVAELRKILPANMVPDGYALPFSFYDRFMKANGFYDEVKAMIADPAFKSDPSVREEKLKDLRKKIKKAAMPESLAAEIAEVYQSFKETYGEAAVVRCRSSTNNEDLPGFNGAGLYDSFSHRPDEGTLDQTVKQVFASMWNFRAFEERDFYRVDHLRAAMGVLLHPNQDDELANGVAYTKNIYDEKWPGFYINAQVGESLVTNPDPGATPDELLISRIGEHGEYETQFISHSSLVGEGKTVIPEARVNELVDAMEIIQAHFKKVYGKQADPRFAMDIEFKIRKDGTLQVKQARPTVD